MIEFQKGKCDRVNNITTMRPSWPDVNDTSIDALLFINTLLEDHRVQIAVQRIKAGNTVAFTTIEPFDSSSFSWKLKERVIKELEKEGHVVDVKERRNEGDDPYAMDTISWLEAYVVSIVKR